MKRRPAPASRCFAAPRRRLASFAPVAAALAALLASPAVPAFAADPAPKPAPKAAPKSDAKADTRADAKPDAKPAAAPESGPDLMLLSNERWSEHSYGISLRPPLGCNLVERTSDDAVLRILGDAGYRISVYVRKSPERPTLEQLLAKLMGQFAVDQMNSTILVDPKETRIAQVRGLVTYIKVVDPKRKDWVMGFAVLQLNPGAYVMFQLESPMTWFQGSRAIFEAVLASMELVNPFDMNEAREAAVARSIEWRSTLKPVDLQQAVIAHQWLRILQNDKEVGYMHVAQKQDREMQSTGIRVDVEAMIQMDKDFTYTTTGRYFVSDSNSMEIWSTQTVGRRTLAPGETPKPDDVRTVSETGVRDKHNIEINRATTAANRKQLKWDLSKRNTEGAFEAKHRMDQAYLSQVDLHLLPRLLPRKNTEPMGFYAYYPNTGKLAYRTERVAVEPDGSFKIYSRPSPEQPEQMTQYNAAGVLVKRALPGGQVLIPTSKAEIAAKWKLPQ